MCYFITIAVPAKKVNLVNGIFGQGLNVTPTGNPCVVSALPNDFAAMLVTGGHCSCGLYSAPGPDRAEDLRRKYAKRGWSGAKIARAVEQATPKMIGLAKGV